MKLIEILCETDEDGLYLIFNDSMPGTSQLLFSMDFNGVLPYWRGGIENEYVKVDGVDEL